MDVHFRKNYYFLYNKIMYRQKKGTAMGTMVALAYVNLFMGAFGYSLIYTNVQYNSKIAYTKGIFMNCISCWQEVNKKHSSLQFIYQNN